MALFGTKKDSKKEDTKKPAARASVKAAKPATKKDEASMQDLYAGKTSSSHPAAKKSSATKAAAYRVLVRPLITEKATHLGAESKYVFQVATGANKIEVAKAIQAVYNVKPLKVNLLNVSGKKVARGRVKGQRSNWRKAIVTLAKGETIKVYEGV